MGFRIHLLFAYISICIWLQHNANGRALQKVIHVGFLFRLKKDNILSKIFVDIHSMTFHEYF